MLIDELYNQNVKTISPEITIKEAIDLMDDADHNGYVVVDNDKHVLGIISIQDIAAATIPEQFRENVNMAKAMYKKSFFHAMCEKIAKDPVTSVMRTKFVSVSLNDNIMAIIADFLNNDLYIVPVVEDEKLIGVVTRTEIKLALSRGMGLK